MSQWFLGPSIGSLPPSVPTTFVTDDGTAIPAAHVLNVNGLESIENNINGIITRANPNLSNNLDIIITNRISVSMTTSDGGGQTQTLSLITPPNSSSLTFRVLVSAYDSINNLSIGGEELGLVRTVGGIVTIVGLNDTFDVSDVALNNADWNIISTSPTLSIQFIGVAGQTIVWRALFEYIQTP